MNSARTFARSNAAFAPAETRPSQLAQWKKLPRLSLSAARLISARHDSSGLDARGCTWREKVGDKKERRCVAGNCRALDEDEEMVETGAGEGKGYYKSALARLLESSECV